MSQTASLILERAVIERESALNRERVLRSAVEEILRETKLPTGYVGRRRWVREVCQAALAETEAAS